MRSTDCDIDHWGRVLYPASVADALTQRRAQVGQPGATVMPFGGGSQHGKVFSGSCTVEILALDGFADLMGGGVIAKAYGHRLRPA